MAKPLRGSASYSKCHTLKRSVYCIYFCWSIGCLFISKSNRFGRLVSAYSWPGGLSLREAAEISKANIARVLASFYSIVVLGYVFSILGKGGWATMFDAKFRILMESEAFLPVTLAFEFKSIEIHNDKLHLFYWHYVRNYSSRVVLSYQWQVWH